MAKAKLTRRFVETATTSNSDTIFWDEQLPGFGLRVKPSGAKSYLVQYRNRSSGASRRKTIGKHGPLMTLHQARQIARGLLADALRGSDPVEDHKQDRNRYTMSDLAQDYLEHHAIPKKRPRSVRSDRSILDNIILPDLGKKRVADVGHAEIQKLHNRLSATPYQANRMLALLSKMFELSIRWGFRSNNPVRGVERYHEEKRYRWLSDAELARLQDALDEDPNQVAANAVRLQLLTGARIGEVMNARWTDFDLDRGVWIKQSHHTKQKRTEHVPLSRAAVLLLTEIGRGSNRGPAQVFPGRVPGQPIKDLKSFWKRVTRAAELEDYRLHDNRHTHASHLVSGGQSLAIVGRLLGHTNPSTTQRYAHLADDPLREAAEIMGKKMSHGSKPV